MSLNNNRHHLVLLCSVALSSLVLWGYQGNNLAHADTTNNNNANTTTVNQPSVHNSNNNSQSDNTMASSAAQQNTSNQADSASTSSTQSSSNYNDSANSSADNSNAVNSNSSASASYAQNSYVSGSSNFSNSASAQASSAVNDYNQAYANANKAAYSNAAKISVANNVQKDYQFTYDDNGNTATVAKYTGNNQDVVIPDSVSNNNKNYSITKIGDSSFDRRNLNSVTIPDTVKEIGALAFSGNNLKSVTIPKSVTSIDAGAFTNNYLSSVNMPATVKYVGALAFDDNNLGSVTIPNYTNVDSSAFDNNVTLNTAYNQEQNGYQLQYNDNDGTASISGYTGNLNNLVLPDVTIHNQEFYHINKVGDYAFNDDDLQSVNIPDSVTSIGNQAFEDNNLSSVKLPAHLTNIGENAFANNNLSSLDLPKSQLSIGKNAFENNNISSVVIPETVQSIGKYAFKDNNLYSVYVKTGSDFLNNVFDNNTNVNYYTNYDDAVSQMNLVNSYQDQTQNGYAFNYNNDGTAEMTVAPSKTTYGNKLIQELIIPKYTKNDGKLYKITKIDGDAGSWGRINTLVIPNTVEEVGQFAFGENGLQTVYISHKTNFDADDYYHEDKYARAFLNDWTNPNSNPQILYTD